MTCTHERYKRNKGEYMTADNALKAMKQNVICWMGITVKECEDCGADLSQHRIVKVKKVEDYIKELKITLQ